MQDDAGEGHSHPAKGEPIIAGKTIWLALAGFFVGGIAGWFVGLTMGQGRLSIAGLAPLVAGGAGVPAIIFASFLGSLLGLAGALIGTSLEARKNRKGQKGHAERHGKKGKQRVIQQLPLYGAITLVLFMGYTLYEIAARGYGSGTPSDQSNRLTWNQKNVSRMGGSSDAETAAHVLQTVYPASRDENRPRTIVTVASDWRAALAATPLIARPTNAAIFISDGGAADATTAREVERLSAPMPAASPQNSPVDSQGLPQPQQSPTAGASPSSAANASPTALQSPTMATSSPQLLTIGTVAGMSDAESISGSDPASLASSVDERRANALGRTSQNVILVSADADYRWALPAGAYAARTGTPILFVTREGVPEATANALRKRGGQARIFALGPAEALPATVFEQLKQFGAVTRIEGGDFFENSVRFAEFRDAADDFGWGHTGRSKWQWATANAILVNGERWQDGIVAAHLAYRGKSGPLLFTERDRIPAVVDNYLWRQRPIFGNTPAEGPFNHLWVVGSFDRIAYSAQAWADYSQEIEQYMTLSDSAVSGYEALGICWMLLSVACAIWIVFHSVKLLPDVMPMMKAAWAIFALILGPLALWLYILSYHRREKMKEDEMVMWHRPVWAQTVSATVMMFAFDMMLMVLAVFLVAYFGFPIIRFNGPLYWLGTSMFLMMVLMYVIALVVMMLVFHTPMTMHEQKINSYWKAFAAGLPIMVATMTVESLGMMPTMWWQQMIYLPAMQMPTEDDFTMWTTLLFSVFIGFLVVLPFNYWMVRKGHKMGTM